MHYLCTKITGQSRGGAIQCLFPVTQNKSNAYSSHATLTKAWASVDKLNVKRQLHSCLDNRKTRIMKKKNFAIVKR